MKKMNLLNLLVLLVGIVLAFSSCEHERPNNQGENYLDTFINNDSARIIASVFKGDFNLEKYKSRSTSASDKSIESILEVPDDNNITAFYIINYKEGGFLILSADKRIDPILAYSDKDNFDLSAKFYPSGLVGWMFNVKEAIQQARDSKKEFTNEMEMKWENILNNLGIIQTQQAKCDYYFETKGPYLATTWGQGCGYNSELQDCESGGSCGKVYVGCVATAMAQVMKYHQYPSSFSWSSMPNNSGSNTTALFMKEIGGKIKMNYGCNGSGAYTIEVSKSLKADYNYTSADYSKTFDANVVESDLDNAKPIVLQGFDKKTGWGKFETYVNGHAWVCDGYSRLVSPSYCWGIVMYYHMNWGWNGSYNGYFIKGNFDPGNGYSFNYLNAMVHNIQP